MENGIPTNRDQFADFLVRKLIHTFEAEFRCEMDRSRMASAKSASGVTTWLVGAFKDSAPVLYQLARRRPVVLQAP